MKRKIKKIIAGITLCIPLFLCAATPANSVLGILNQTPTTSNKKRIPSRTFIKCIREDGILVFDANFEYECIEVDVSGPESFSEMLTPLQPFIETPSLSGTYTICCTTEGGTIYEGTITL